MKTSAYIIFHASGKILVGSGGTVGKGQKNRERIGYFLPGGTISFSDVTDVETVGSGASKEVKEEFGVARADLLGKQESFVDITTVSKELDSTLVWYFVIEVTEKALLAARGKIYDSDKKKADSGFTECHSLTFREARTHFAQYPFKSWFIEGMKMLPDGD